MEINTIKELNYKGFDCFINRVGFYKTQSVREAIDITGSDISVCATGGCVDNGENNTWVIGFDCNHYGDGEKENTEEFVASEIQKVVDQLLDPEKDLRGLLDDMAWGEG